VLPDSTICSGSRLAAGGVLTGKCIPPDEIWGGVPAKFIRKRGEV
jgi:acetyltransferase-like isoleucine patch superfamily enzyme